MGVLLFPRNDWGLCPYRPHATWIVVFLLACTYTMTLISNLIVVFRLRAAHSIKQRMSYRRATAYSISFVVAYLPMVAGFAPLHLANNFTEETTWYFALEYTSESLNGLLNFATYALQSRYANILVHRSSTIQRRYGRRASHHVHVPAQVEFGGVSVIEVLPLAAIAALQAERELSVLEDKGFNGLWLRSDTGETLAIQGNRIRWPNGIITEFGVDAEGHVVLDVDSVRYFGRVEEGAQVVRWSDGDLWQRQFASSSTTSPFTSFHAGSAMMQNAAQQSEDSCGLASSEPVLPVGGAPSAEPVAD